MKCRKCDREMDFCGKDTSSGREIRSYYCWPCRQGVDVDDGIALWKVLRDAHKPKQNSIDGDGNPCAAGFRCRED